MHDKRVPGQAQRAAEAGSEEAGASGAHGGGGWRARQWSREGAHGGRAMKQYAWETVKQEPMRQGIWRKVVSGDRAMLAQVFIPKGAVVPTHQHESEQLSYIVEGALKFGLEGKEIVVRKGEVLHIPSNVPHMAVALEDTLDLDVFSPIRVDWLTGQDDYLRK